MQLSSLIARPPLWTHNIQHFSLLSAGQCKPSVQVHKRTNEKIQPLVTDEELAEFEK